jgi:hypothetical protein
LRVFRFAACECLCTPIPLVQDARLNRKLWRFFQPQFSDTIKQLLRLVPPGNALLDQKALPMELITATDGFALLRSSLRAIRRKVEVQATASSDEDFKLGRLSRFTDAQKVTKSLIQSLTL